jgi:biopolymer transport protein ExbB
MLYLFVGILLAAAQVDGASSEGSAKPPAAVVEGAAPAAADGPKSPGTPAASPASAENTAAAAEEGKSSEAAAPWYKEILKFGLLGYMIEGGIFMWPILVLGILAAGVIIERFRSLRMLGTDTAALRARVQGLLQADQVEEALELCDREQGPVPAVLSTGLRKFLVLRRLNYDAGRIEEQVVKSMDDYGVHIVAALERHLPILATVSSVAPMIGFLGTVQGMVVSFRDIVAQMGEKNIVEAAAAGIMVSLLTTVFGLIVGIPAFMAFNYYTSVINRFVLDVEESATELIETVTLQMALRQQAETPSEVKALT